MCGRHTDLISLRLSNGWCQTSYRVFEKLQEILPADTASGHGIRMRVANFFFDKPIEENEEEYEKMLEIEAAQVSIIVIDMPLSILTCFSRSMALNAMPPW